MRMVASKEEQIERTLKARNTIEQYTTPKVLSEFSIEEEKTSSTEGTPITAKEIILQTFSFSFDQQTDEL